MVVAECSHALLRPGIIFSGPIALFPLMVLSRLLNKLSPAKLRVLDSSRSSTRYWTPCLIW